LVFYFGNDRFDDIGSRLGRWRDPSSGGSRQNQLTLQVAAQHTMNIQQAMRVIPPADRRGHDGLTQPSLCHQANGLETV
jgi:hypothetical protein